MEVLLLDGLVEREPLPRRVLLVQQRRILLLRIRGHHRQKHGVQLLVVLPPYCVNFAGDGVGWKGAHLFSGLPLGGGQRLRIILLHIPPRESPFVVIVQAVSLQQQHFSPRQEHETSAQLLNAFQALGPRSIHKPRSWLACNSGRPHIIGIQGRPPELVPQAHGGPRHDDQAHARHQSQLRAGPPADRLEVLGGRPALERYALHTREAWQVHPVVTGTAGPRRASPHALTPTKLHQRLPVAFRRQRRN
mmetsp:Transcript_4307/g.12414  ORF Transcript_4307/g.12414 Transcript_4307/m.12414 type:complete len:248 (+) Transcript_4307:862-1605(+)